MSYTTIYIIDKDGNAVEKERIANAWLSAAYIWDKLYRSHINSSGIFLLDADNLWQLVDDERLLDFEKLTLASTFDWAIIEYEKFPDMIAVYRKFFMHYPGDCHIPKFVEFLQNAESCIGMCFQQTSVSQDLWTVHTNDNGSRPYNVNIDNNHFFVFEKYGER